MGKIQVSPEMHYQCTMYVPSCSLMSEIGHRYCLASTSCMTGLLNVFILLHI